MDYLATMQHQKLQMTRNPIVVLVDPVVLAPGASRVDLRYQLELRIQKSFQNSQFINLPIQEASEKPVPDGYTISPGAYFEVQTRIDDQLSATPPVYADNFISVCPNLTRQYYYVSSAYNDETLIRTETSTTLWAIRAQMAMRHFSMYKDVFFTQVIGGQLSKFLTWQPDGKLVRTDQPERLYFLTNFTPSPRSLNLRARVYYADNSAETFTAKTVDNVTPMTVYSVPVGYSELNLQARTKPVTWYEVWLSNENGEQVSETRFYRIDRFAYESVKYIVFQNSLGGYDTLRCVGSASESVSINRQILERFTDYDYLPTVSEVLINNVTGERQITVNVGNWLNANHREYLEDLALSEEFYIVDGDEFIPLTPNFGGLTTQSNTEWPIERTLSFTYANGIGGYSKLPKIVPVTRQTGWKQWSVSCQLDANGLRTGKQIVNELVKYYLDSGENVRPITTKANISGTDGYIPPWDTGACAASTTPFFNTFIAGQSNFKKSTCGNGQVGTTWAIAIPAGSYGSELSQADAQAKAQTAWTALDTQANADSSGGCIPAVNLKLGLINYTPGDGNGNYGGSYNPIGAIMINDVELIPNTTYTGAPPRFSDTTLPAGTRNIDVRCMFANVPTLPYRVSIPSKNQTSPVLSGPQTYRFANIVSNWGDPDLIIRIDPA
ncbi:DUF5977 domain-containing protein [Dyadobacter sp. LHD-138]|uniref:DUF5977 domain-containing protein n=1 Tax=Dyadobacter sp. LHD-138 TaxID=3071413 RepID=UPI0027E0637C|nr:DUF5977 domain-containing protein [Dyadobacter sp. LHD-138]MDQ6479796.1 DUF5977 domain-containing protein [Dyadobacter sp. LHD-138]